MTSLRTLIVADSDHEPVAFIDALAQAGYQVQMERVGVVTDLQAALDRGPWDVCLLAAGAMSLDPIAALGEAVPRLPDAALFLYIGDPAHDALATRALGAGAHDVASADRLDRFVLAVGRELRAAAHRRERRLLMQQLEMSSRLAAIGTVAAGVAHELNSPLTVAIANLAYLSEELRRLAPPMGEDGAELQRLVGEIQISADRVRRLLRDLLAFARPTGERRAPVDLHRSLELATSVVAHQLRHRARVVRSLEQVPLVEANESQLAHAMAAILSAAVDALPESGREEREIRLSSRTDGDGWAVLEIEAVGAIVSPDAQERLFDPLGIASARGLGLAMAESIVASFGGKLGFADPTTRDCRLTLRMPPAQVLPGQTTSDPETSGQIMLVDDDPMIRKVISRTLGGDRVTVFADARSALEALRGPHGFVLVISDVMMPGMNGVEFHRALAEQSPQLSESLIFMTGGGGSREVQEALDALPNLRLEKPFDPKNLRALVAERTRGVRRDRGEAD